MKADLGDIDLGCFVGSKENVVMGGVFCFEEPVRGEVTAKVVAAAGSHVNGTEDFFVLDVPIGNGEDLGAEAEFADFPGGGIAGHLGIVGLDNSGVALE